MKTVRFLRPAEIEVFDAASYYELQAPKLSDEFLDEIASSVKDMGEYPERWSVVRFNVRRRLVNRVLYGLLYRIDPDEVIVLATMHLHRHPNYWIDRS